jgi:hypothetical protein
VPPAIRHVKPQFAINKVKIEPKLSIFVELRGADRVPILNPDADHITGPAINGCGLPPKVGDKADWSGFIVCVSKDFKDCAGESTAASLGVISL